MWFGTEDGLNRFDGYEFRQLRHDRGDSESLPNGWISSLVASEDGLWIATDGGGVVFRNARHRQTRGARAVARRARPAARAHAGARPPRPVVDRRRATPGVAIFDPRSSELRRMRHSPTEANSLSDNSIFSLLHLRNGDTLVGTAQRPRSPVRGQSRRHAHRAARGTRRRGQAAARARADRIPRRHGLGGHGCTASAASIRAAHAGASIAKCPASRRPRRRAARQSRAGPAHRQPGPPVDGH